MAWIRDGGPPDKIKVSFEVKKEDYPELVEWWWTLPFRGQSTAIRDILSEAAKMVSSEASGKHQPAPAKPPQKHAEAPGRQSAAPRAAEPKPGPSSVAMTEATATILRNMRSDF